MNISRSESTASFFTPTTCLTVACVALSLVALSTVWRNSNPLIPSTAIFNESEKNIEEHAKARSRSRRRGTNRRSHTDEEELPPNVEDVRSKTIQQRQTEIGDVVLLSARTAQLSLVSPSRTEIGQSGLDLSNELSALTSSLCQLQQEVSSSDSFLRGDEGLISPFNDVVGSLETGLKNLGASFSSDVCNTGDVNAAMRQIRDRMSTLNLLLRSSRDAIPPTPLPESLVGPLLQDPQTPGSSQKIRPMVKTDAVPASRIDDERWNEPPPKYSPPTKENMPLLAEKPVDKIEAVITVVPSHHREDSLSDGDALYNAVTLNDSQALADLLALGMDSSARFGDLQRTPLHTAAHLNNHTCLSVLLKHGAKLDAEDAKGDTAIHLASWAGNVEALSTLLAHDTDAVNWLSGRDGYSPLWCAISAFHIDAARLILKHGARVSLRAASGGGLTPLHQAAVTKQTAMVELLLERGAQPDCLDEDENTPLHYAAASGSVASVKVLLRSGADMEREQANGLTPVHWAAHKNHVDALGILLDAGAGLDRKAHGGATPLHLASSRGHMAAARLLISRGANRNARAVWSGVSGTPAQMAKAKGHVQLAKQLG